MILLETKNLTKRYPNFILNEVSLSLESGKILGLVGKNGAGKSTFIKCLLHLVRPDDGTITMFGKDFLKNETESKSKLGVVLGGIDCYLNETLNALTETTRRFYPEWNDRRYRNYLNMFDLDPSKKVKELSSGMRVKYLIALALSHNAKLFIFDEPTSGLDPVSRNDLLVLFRELVKDGTRSVLFSTHITSDLEKCADEIAYLHDGNLIANTLKSDFSTAFPHLLKDGETELPIEEIMIRTERSNYDFTACL